MKQPWVLPEPAAQQDVSTVPNINRLSEILTHESSALPALRPGGPEACCRGGEAPAAGFLRVHQLAGAPQQSHPAASNQTRLLGRWRHPDQLIGCASESAGGNSLYLDEYALSAALNRCVPVCQWHVAATRCHLSSYKCSWPQNFSVLFVRDSVSSKADVKLTYFLIFVFFFYSSLPLVRAMTKGNHLFLMKKREEINQSEFNCFQN